MVSEFLQWWAQQLRASLPARLTQDGVDASARGLTAALHLPPPGPPGVSSVDVQARRKGRNAALGRFALDPAGIAALRAAAAGQGAAAAVLRLPPELLLEQQVALPIAAERDPERVLQYEMDRITPFAADDLFWSWAVDRRDRAGGRLHLRLFLVPKARLLPVLDALRQAGLRPAALEAAAGNARRRVARDRPPPARWRRRGLAVAGAACAVLAVAAVAVPFAVQSVRSADVERRIAALRPRADEAEALRRRILSSAAGTDVFAEQRARVGDALSTLATITDVLPDDTYLTELTMRTRTVTVSGQSAGAARLIAALAAERSIRNPAFAAPVTRNEGTRSEGFSIRAEVAPGVAP